MIAADVARTAIRCATGSGVTAAQRDEVERYLRRALRDADRGGTGGATPPVLGSGRLLADCADGQLDAVSTATAVAILAGADDERTDRWLWAVTAAAAVAVLRAGHADPLRAGPVLTGVLLGAELNCRLWTALGTRHAAVWTAAGSVGGIGAALTAGVLLGLDERRATHAIAIASSTTSGHRTHEATDLGAFQAGCAAGNGVLAAYLAAAGVTGSPGAIEGPRGLLHAYGGDAAADGLLDDFGTRWTVLDGSVPDGPMAPDGAAEPGWLTSALHRLPTKVAG